MKKRLLSAALALAMLLTLLPVTAFAATGDASGSGASIRYYTDAANDNVQITADGWYEVSGTGDATTYALVTNGVVTNTGAWTNGQTGTWYPNVKAAIDAGNYSVKFIKNNVTDSVTLTPTGNLSVDVNGIGWSVSNGISVWTKYTAAGGAVTTNPITKIEIKNSNTAVPLPAVNVGTGIVASVNPAAGDTLNVAVELSNVAVTGAVTVNHNGGTSYSGGSMVTVNNATVSGAVSVIAYPSTTSGASTTNGSVTVTGIRASVGSIKVESSQPNASAANYIAASGGSVTVSGGAKVTTTIGLTASSGGSISVSGSGTRVGSTVTLTTGSGGSVSVSELAETGLVSFHSTKGSNSNSDPTVTVDNATVAAINSFGDSVKVNVQNHGIVKGDVALFGRAGSTLSTATESASTLVPPALTVSGTVQGNIKVAGTTTEALEKEYTITVTGSGMVVGTIDLPKADIKVNNGGTVTGKTTLNSGTLTVGPTGTLGEVELGADATDTAAGSSAVMVVSGFGNKIGKIADVTSTTSSSITLTIPGVNGTSQNPKDHDTNTIDSVVINDLSKWKGSTIAGGHYRAALNSRARQLLTDGITYVVKETASGKYGTNYPYSYWGNTVYLMNTLAAMTTIDSNTIWTKDAPTKTGTPGTVDSSAKTIGLYVYAPRTEPNPGGVVGTENDRANKLLDIKFLAPESFGRNTLILPSVLGTNTSINWSPLKNEPTQINSTQFYRVTVDAAATKIVGGSSIVAETDKYYVSNSLSNRVTKVLNVSTATGASPTVKAQLSNGSIVLSGLAVVPGMTNSVVIPLVLETDAYAAVTVNAVWNPTDNTLRFADTTTALTTQTNGGMEISNANNAYLVIVENNTRIGLTSSNLTEFNLSLEIQGNGTKADKNLGGMTTVTTRIPNTQVEGTARREALAKAMTVYAGTDGVVDFSNSPTVQQEFGAYIAKLTQTQLNTWLRKAQEEKYNEAKEKSGQTKLTQAELNKLTDAQLATETGYDTIAAVLYMNVDITAFNSGTTYTMTATMTPYARVEVQHGTQADGDWTKNPPVIVSGTAASLGTLDSTNVGYIKVTLPDVSTAFGLGAKTMKPATHAHQNDTYGAEVDSKDASFYLSHTAANGAGFGTIVLKNDVPIAEVQKLKSGTRNQWESYNTADASGSMTLPYKKLYDTVQAAVDDVKNGEKIVVSGSGTTKEYPINVTGRARTFYIDVTGNDKITRANNSSGYTITQPTSNSTTYTVQLLSSTTPSTPVLEGVPITVAAATGGSVSASASRANVGTSVTLTAQPSSGYVLNSLTIRTNTGANVNYSSSATNVYSFVVPDGAESIIVTPTFVRSNTTALISVNNNASSNGVASISSGVGSDSRARGGDTVTITTRPYNGYRTLSVSAVAVINGANSSVTVSRIADNTYTFVVPVNATSVTVTPSFTQSGHPFIDVPDGQWYSDAVTYVYNHGMMYGAGSEVTFSGTTPIRRCDLVLILYRLSGEPSVSAYSSFNDVSPSAYYAAAVTWASGNGIVTGGSGNNFYPTNNITRQDLASILYRYNSYRGGSTAGTSTLSGYTDRNEISDYALTSMQWAVGNNIVSGSYSSLMPRSTATRYEVATMLMRYCQNFLNMQ